jgi:lipopolysaccharide export system permease protein
MTNTVIPLAEFKTYNLRKNLAKMKPALAISEGMFNDMGASTIKVSNKYGPDDRLLEDVIIHEKSKSEKNNIVIRAESGELKDAEITDGLQLVLYNGNRYEEIVNRKRRSNPNKHPHARVAFEKYTMNIDLSDFNNVDLSETKYNNTFKMQTVSELRYSIDSLEQKYADEVEGFVRTTYIRTGAKSIATKQDSMYVYSGLKPFVNSFSNNNRKSILNQAKSSVKSLKSNLDQQKKTFFFREKVINLHAIYMYDKYIIGFSALLMFFVGAPLGAIIRKGGFGLPVVLALIIFLTYHFAGTFFKNSAEDGSISNFMGTSVTSIALLIFSISLIRRASADKSVFNPANTLHRFKEFLLVGTNGLARFGKRIFAKK